jgi:hypothetical protein
MKTDTARIKIIFGVLVALILCGLAIRSVQSTVWMSGLVDVMLSEHTEYSVDKNELPSVQPIEFFDFSISVFSIIFLAIGSVFYLIKGRGSVAIMVLLTILLVIYWTRIVEWHMSSEYNYYALAWLSAGAAKAHWIFVVRDVLYPISLISALLVLGLATLQDRRYG